MELTDASMRSHQPLVATVGDAVRAYAGMFAMVAASTLLGLWIAPRWGTAPVDMIYLPAVLGAAALWGLWPGVVAGVTSALAYNFFFTAPLHTLRIDRAADIVTVSVLLIVALVTGRLAAGIRKQAQIADAHAARNAVIAGFARRLLSCSTEEEIARVTCEELRRLFDCNSVVVSGLPTPQVIAMAPDGNRLTPSDLAAAVLAIGSSEPAGRGTGRVQPAEWVFNPIRSGAATLAAAGLARAGGAPAAGAGHHESVTRPLALTPKEYALLAELAKHRGRVLSHPHLLRTVWGPAQENQTDYLRVAIRSLRQKLEAEPSRPQLIINEPGVGYRLTA